MSAAIALVPHALDALGRLHPNISVELIEGTDAEGEPIYAEHVQILGRVTGVFRSL